MKNIHLIYGKDGLNLLNVLYLYSHQTGVVNSQGGNYVKVYNHGNDGPIVDHLNRKRGND